jgi:hypothetical protein
MPYKKAAAAPQGSPNPSRHGEFAPLHTASARQRRRRRRRGEGDPEAYRQLAADLAKPEDRTWEPEDAAKPRTATPLLPLLRAAVSFHADDPASSAPPRFTAACTSARGHQGEAKPPHPSVVDPAFEPSCQAGTLFCAGAAAAVAANAHTRRRFPFLTPRHPHVTDARHAAVVLQSAAPPACSTPFHTSTSACHPHKPGSTTASTP